MNGLEQLNQLVSQLSVEQIEKLSENEILGMAVGRPGHPGQYGFMLQISYFKSKEHLADTIYALMKRLEKVDNLKEKMKRFYTPDVI